VEAYNVCIDTDFVLTKGGFRGSLFDTARDRTVCTWPRALTNGDEAGASRSYLFSLQTVCMI
jgi:hypothetical protein